LAPFQEATMARPVQLAASLFLLMTGPLFPNFASARPNYVDLSANQTPIRNQGAQGSCIVFASTAALEAAYNRAGFGQIDLSEALLNHFGKMMWIHPKWNETAAKGADGRESQVGAYSGGGGVQYLKELANGLRITVESAMPYRKSGYTVKDMSHLANAWYSPFWTQRRANDFNLDPRFLTRAALTQPLYYSVKHYATVNGKDTNAIEDVLASGKEVVWDFTVATKGQGQIIWTPCARGQPDCPTKSGHAMLLIGYDRRDPNPGKHYFLVKNSWGRTQWPDGYTRISYDYLRQYGSDAGYITEVEAPRPWPELAFIGRWNLNADDQKGILDIYRVPGVSNWLIRENGGQGVDNRIGSFYDEAGQAYRVNGRITADHIEFYIDANNRNPRWDQIGGRRFVYSRPIDQIMTGFQTDPNGHVSAGIATQGTIFTDTARTPRPFAATAFLGSWTATFLSARPAPEAPALGTLKLDRIDNNFLSPAERNQFDGLAGELFDGGTGRFEVRALVDRAQPNKIALRLRRTAPVAETRIWEVIGFHLEHADGIVAGRVATNNLGMILTRDAGAQVPSVMVSQATYGGNCSALEGNATGVLANACNGRARCEYTVDFKILGDPAPGCHKDFAVEWQCNGITGKRRTSIPGEAGRGSTITVACDSSEAPGGKNFKLSTK
jgi:hypothetical protein